MGVVIWEWVGYRTSVPERQLALWKGNMVSETAQVCKAILYLPSIYIAYPEDPEHKGPDGSMKNTFETTRSA